MYVDRWNAVFCTASISGDGVEFWLTNPLVWMYFMFCRVLIFGLSTQMCKRCRNPKPSIAFKLGSL
jgi:hypothetical protein